MKTTNTILSLMAALMVLFAATSSAMSKGNKIGDDAICGVSREDLSKCMPAVATGTAAPPPPTVECCTAVSRANLTCFCTFKNNKYLPLLGINATRAMDLPTDCDKSVKIPCSV